MRKAKKTRNEMSIDIIGMKIKKKRFLSEKMIFNNCINSSEYRDRRIKTIAKFNLANPCVV